jgi:DNA-binding MarR family transcriptional regulator
MTGTEPHLQVRAEAFGLAFLVAQQLTRRADAALEQVGLTTSQWLLLAVLARRFPGEAPRLSEAAAVHGSSRQNVKQIARQLEARGWLELRADPGDARALRLHLTRKVALFDRPSARARQARLMDELFAALGPGEVVDLERLLRRWFLALEGRSEARRRRTPWSRRSRRISA